MLKGFVTKEEKATIKNKENIIFFPKQLQSVFLIPSKRGVKGGKMEAWEKEKTHKKKTKYRVTIMTVATNKLKWVGATTGFTLIKMNHSIYLPQSL